MEILRVVERGGTAVATLCNTRCLERRLWDVRIRQGWRKRVSAGFYGERNLEKF